MLAERVLQFCGMRRHERLLCCARWLRVQVEELMSPPTRTAHMKRTHEAFNKQVQRQRAALVDSVVATVAVIHGVGATVAHDDRLLLCSPKQPSLVLDHLKTAPACWMTELVAAVALERPLMPLFGQAAGRDRVHAGEPLVALPSQPVRARMTSR